MDTIKSYQSRITIDGRIYTGNFVYGEGIYLDRKIWYFVYDIMVNGNIVCACIEFLQYFLAKPENDGAVRFLDSPRLSVMIYSSNPVLKEELNSPEYKLDTLYAFYEGKRTRAELDTPEMREEFNRRIWSKLGI